MVGTLSRAPFFKWLFFRDPSKKRWRGKKNLTSVSVGNSNQKWQKFELKLKMAEKSGGLFLILISISLTSGFFQFRPSIANREEVLPDPQAQKTLNFDFTGKARLMIHKVQTERPDALHKVQQHVC